MAWHPPGLAMVELMVQVLSMPALVHGRALIGMTNSAQWLDAAKKAQPERVARMQDTYRMCELVYGELTYNHPNRPLLFRQYCDIMARLAPWGSKDWEYGRINLIWRILRPSRRESMAQRAILFRSSEKEKQRFTRSGNLYVALYAWYA